MGTKLGDVVTAETISLNELARKAIAIDAFNTLYQFLATIRQPDGTPLQDFKGRVTSHLTGLFYRTLNLLEHEIRPVYVFDGESPLLKAAEIERRRMARDAAYEDWIQAREEGRIEDARKAAQGSSRLSGEMVEESKLLLQALGVPCVQAPSEGEALAAQMARSGEVWASASQDYDSLLYGSPRVIRNLSVSGRRRASRGGGFKTVLPEVVDLEVNLRVLGLTRVQLIDVAILLGTDYNEKVAGVGWKKAVKLIKQHGRLETAAEAAKIRLDFSVDEIRNIFLNPPSIETPQLHWTDPNEDAVLRILCREHNFSEERVNTGLSRLSGSRQSALSDFM
ncbi:MAG: flap endonuclease-1 [Candidatus Thorarchaeota archaeon]|nr:flap endonuclease-1 [Candidatus Thorarchaeota archaeon]